MSPEVSTKMRVQREVFEGRREFPMRFRRKE
jgi:hypothetical protein